MKKKYKFTGKLKVYLAGLGEVKPDEVIEVEREINHPDFEPIEEDQPKKGKKEEKE
ncbi:hypothetical protein HYW66_01390 [Candidatus Microgenomates bacterium]|nr:hypothetical protein [Candidatus Microgenomates bacterium]